MKIFAYLRLSVGETENASLDYQEADILRRFSPEYPAIEFHRETASAVKNIRPIWESLLARIMEDAKKGEKPILLVWAVDRILRSAEDFPAATRILDAGILVRTFRDGDFTADQFFSFAIRAIMAIEEPRSTKKRQSARYADGMKKGEWFWSVPPGYIRRGTQLFADPQKSESVREIFQDFLLFRGGVEAYAPTVAAKLGKKYFSKSGLFDFFGNRFLIGEVTFRGEVFPDHHDGIIPRDLFFAVREKIKKQTQKSTKKHDLLFRGIIFCACGRRFIGETQKGTVYYRCHRCRHSFRQDIPEKCVSEFFQKNRLTPEGAKFYLAKIKEEKQESFKKNIANRANVQKRIHQIDEILSGLLDMRATGEIDSASFLEKKNALMIERAEKLQKMNESESQFPKVFDTITKMLELIETQFLSWDFAEEEKKSLILQMLGSNFFFSSEKRLEMRIFPFLQAYFSRGCPVWQPPPSDSRKTDSDILIFETFFFKILSLKNQKKIPTK